MPRAAASVACRVWGAPRAFGARGVRPERTACAPDAGSHTGAGPVGRPRQRAAASVPFRVWGAPRAFGARAVRPERTACAPNVGRHTGAGPVGRPRQRAAASVPFRVWGAPCAFGACAVRPERTACAPNPGRQRARCTSDAGAAPKRHRPLAQRPGSDGCRGLRHPSPVGFGARCVRLGRARCAPNARHAPQTLGDIGAEGPWHGPGSGPRHPSPSGVWGASRAFGACAVRPERTACAPNPERQRARGTSDAGAEAKRHRPLAQRPGSDGCRGLRHPSPQEWRRSRCSSAAACTTSGPSRRSSARSRCTTRPRAMAGRPSTRGSAAATETFPRVISSRVVA